jgi:transcriptional regulator with XRE-family HTH domain
VKTKAKISEQYIKDYRESVGRNIRLIREKKGYSQDELAEIMDVHRSTISKIETGKFAITIDYMVKFAWYLDFDISFIDREFK